jgi:hypothetical protein
MGTVMRIDVKIIERKIIKAPIFKFKLTRTTFVSAAALLVDVNIFIASSLFRTCPSAFHSKVYRVNFKARESKQIPDG